MVILCDQDIETAVAVNKVCRKNGVKFIMADTMGVYCRLFNDFGDKFEVLDKNGEELIDLNISKISSDKEALVEILQNQKHKLEDGDEVLLSGIEGMKLKEGIKHEEEAFKKLDSINETIQKVKVMTPYSFKIGDTTKYEPYQAKGIVKQLRTKVTMKSISLEEALQKDKDSIPFDLNLMIADFEKLDQTLISHVCYTTLDRFRVKNKKMPSPWNLDDAMYFAELGKEVCKELKIEDEELGEEGNMLKNLY